MPAAPLPGKRRRRLAKRHADGARGERQREPEAGDHGSTSSYLQINLVIRQALARWAEAKRQPSLARVQYMYPGNDLLVRLQAPVCALRLQGVPIGQSGGFNDVQERRVHFQVFQSAPGPSYLPSSRQERLRHREVLPPGLHSVWCVVIQEARTWASASGRGDLIRRWCYRSLHDFFLDVRCVSGPTAPRDLPGMSSRFGRFGRTLPSLAFDREDRSDFPHSAVDSSGPASPHHPPTLTPTLALLVAHLSHDRPYRTYSISVCMYLLPLTDGSLRPLVLRPPHSFARWPDDPGSWDRTEFAV